MMVKRLLLVLLTAVLALGAAGEVRMAFSSDGLDGFEVLLLACCCAVRWVAFGFVVSAIGFMADQRRTSRLHRPARSPPACASAARC
jgi:membrane glycosyltransferase